MKTGESLNDARIGRSAAVERAALKDELRSDERAGDRSPTRGARRGVGMTVAVGAVVALAGFMIGTRPLADNSFFTHLATGRLILRHGIPHVDPYSFTAHGHLWVVQSWLASAIYAIADRIGGGHALVLLQGCFSAALAGLIWRLARPAETLISRIIVIMPAIAIGASWWVSRPLMFGLLFFAACVLLAEQDELSPWWLLPIGWLWVNSHGSFPFGPLYFGVRLVGRAIDHGDLSRMRRLFIISVAGVLVGGVNPLGLRLLAFPLSVLGRGTVLHQVVEWRSPDFTNVGNLAFLLSAVAALVMLQRRRSWEEALVAGVLAGAGLFALRNTLIASIALTPILARGVRGLGRIRGDRRTVVALAATGAVVVVAFASLASTLNRPAYDLKRYPVAELNWMNSHGLLQKRVAAPDYVGNFRTLREGANAEVFIDDRYDMYPSAVARSAFAVSDGARGALAELRRRGIDVFLWDRRQAIATIVAESPEWRVVHQTEKWIVAERV